ncbi:MAG: hypothetical protein HYX55_05100 [Chloroflexi bacterium]|nr:hypothetical protein [Chloroflexota bacterium]
MSTTRDPDRLLRAWLDLMPDEAPDRAIATVLQAVETTRQARVLPRIGPWRYPMNRLSIIATAALVITALVGGAYLLAGGTKSPAPATPTAAPTAKPTATAAAAIAPPAQPIWGDWAADVPAIPAFSQPAAQLQLSIDWQNGLTIWIQRSVLDDCCNAFKSTSLQAGPKELRVRADLQVLGCEAAQEGLYTWNRSTDGLFLTLTLVADACPNRAAVFARTWVHSLGAVNDGGPGVNYGVTPMIQMALPTGQRYGMDGGEQAPEIKTFGDVQPFRAFVVVRNPGGFGAPCSATDTKKMNVARTTDAFVTYVKGLPGATVQTSTTMIGGRPAVRLGVSIDPAVKCLPSGIQAFHPEKLTDTFDWWFNPGEVQPLYIVQMDASTTFLLWYQGTADEERAVLASIKFIDKLPTP